jgi:hypothetical protein
MAKDPSRLDLVRSFATELALRAVAEIDFAPLTDLMAEYGMSDQEGRRFAFFQTEYRRSRVKHESVGSILQVEPKTQRYRFTVTYSVGAGTGASMREGTKPVLDMLHLLSDMPEEHQFTCRAGFQYPANRYTSCIPIPLAVRDSTKLPYTDIRGVHLAKVRDGSLLYDIIIDHAAPESEVVLHLTTFEYVGGFTSDLPGDVLRFALDISHDFGELHD